MHQLVAELERLIAADSTHPGASRRRSPPASDGVARYLAQDYVAADSLDLVVREYGPAPAADALRVAAQLAGALDFAAAVHVVARGAASARRAAVVGRHPADRHRRGRARSRSRRRRRRCVVPTPRPERIAGGAWDRRADVFSLAMLIHEMLWARRVSGLGGEAVDSADRRFPAADLDTLRAVFARALAEDPASRFETALEFAGQRSGAPSLSSEVSEELPVASDLAAETSVASHPSSVTVRRQLPVISRHLSVARRQRQCQAPGIARRRWRVRSRQSPVLRRARAGGSGQAAGD